MEALKKQLKAWKPKIEKDAGLKMVKSAYQGGSPYLTETKICSICGPSSNVISM